MLLLGEILFVFWVVLGTLLYWSMTRREKQIAYKAKNSGVELSEADSQAVKNLRETRSKAMFGIAMLAAAMLMIVISQLIR